MIEFRRIFGIELALPTWRKIQYIQNMQLNRIIFNRYQHIVRFQITMRETQTVQMLNILNKLMDKSLFLFIQ